MPRLPLGVHKTRSRSAQVHARTDHCTKPPAVLADEPSCSFAFRYSPCVDNTEDNRTSYRELRRNCGRTWLSPNPSPRAGVYLRVLFIPPPSIVTPSPSLETLGSMKNRRNILPSRLAGRGQSRNLFDGRPEVHYANQD